MDKSPEGNTRATNSNGGRFPEAWSRGTEFMRPQHFGIGQNGGFDVQPTHPEAYIYQSPPMFRESTHTESTPTPLPAFKANCAQIEPRFTPSPVGYTTQYHRKRSLNPAIVATFPGRSSTPDSGIGSLQEEQPQNSVFSGEDQSEETSENLDLPEYPSEEQEYNIEEQEISEERQQELALKEDAILEAENPVVEGLTIKVEKERPILKRFPAQPNYDAKLMIKIPKPTENTSCFAGIIANIRNAAREFRKTIALGREKEYDEVDDTET